MTAPLLEVADLRVDLPTPRGAVEAVRGVDLTVRPGETLCLVGESGCGKSMTALAVMGLLPAKARRRAARMAFDGADLADPRTAERLRGDRLSMVFQEPMTALNPTFRIGDQLIAVHRRHRAAGRTAARDRAVELLERVGIADAGRRLSQYPHELSGGLRQRVMIAMALMCGPALILADEPTTALDVTIQAEILGLLKDLQAEFGMAMVVITHDLGVVSRIADRIAVMYAGQVVEQGPTAALLDRPRHPYTRGLIDCVPSGDHPRGQPLGTIPGTVPALIDPPSACAFAPRCGRRIAACTAGIPPLRPDPVEEGARHLRCLNPVA
ncbi:MAG: ATP-binding cassette domain-containing protein [Alphaproteobacteria bacterium]|jgi:peptide/nickel transport system ATP-binding protein|nr:ATP-binding cassette domain-containing protein [Alphaproteobacteria bacterium]